MFIELKLGIKKVNKISVWQCLLGKKEKYKLLLFEWKKVLKKRRMRIFEHRIFSKSFGGKICHNWTDVTYRACEKINKTENCTTAH